MSKKKDVLFLCQYFYPEYISSATLPYDTAVSLAKAGFSVGALCGYPQEYSASEKVPLKEYRNGIDIKRLKYIQLKRSNSIGRLINYFSFTFSVAINFMELKKYKSIMVYSNPPILPFIAAMANKFFGTKIIFVSYDIYPEIAQVTNITSTDSLMSKFMRKLNKSIFKHVNHVVALSNEMKEYLLKSRATLSSTQITVIPNWYEDKGVTEFSESFNNKLFRGIKREDNLVVSYFGNMGIAQDLDTLLDTIRLLKNDNGVQFIFAGHGNKMEHLKMTVRSEGLNNVNIFDFLHDQDFQDALNISDCFVVSLAEGLTGLAVPSKTYSYMMAGKPIIAVIGEESDIAKDLHSNNAGYSIQVGESRKFFNAIQALRNDKEKRVLMGRNCREIYLEKYTLEKCTGQYIKMIKKVLEGNSNV